MEKEKAEKELDIIYQDIEKLRKKVIEINSKLAKMDIEQDYVFHTPEGKEIKLSEMFGDQKYLYTIHNMGKACSYCTMWADGFKDTYKKIQEKGSFFLVSPDSPQIHKEFKDSRGWKYNSVSSEGNTFTKDVGYYVEGKGYWPGVSVFEKSDDGKIKRVSKDFFGPGDPYCNIWHFYDLLPAENVTMNS